MGGATTTTSWLEMLSLGDIVSIGIGLLWGGPSGAASGGLLRMKMSYERAL